MKKQVAVQEIDGINVLVVDDEGFDWGLDPDHLASLHETCLANPNLKDAMVATIQKHFVESFSEFLGTPVTLTQICDAIEQGWIEV